MKNYILSFIFVFVSVFPMSAQNKEKGFTLRPTVGINFSKFSGDFKYDNQFVLGESQVDKKSKIGIHFGIELQQRIKENIGASIGVFYSQEGSKFSDYSSETDQIKTVITDFSTNLSYLNIPILSTLDVLKWNHSAVTLKLGVQLGFLLKGKSENTISFYKKIDDQWILNDENSGVFNQDITSLYKKINFSLPVGIEYTYNNYSISLQYTMGLTKAHEYFDNVRNNRFSLSIGYGITL